MNAAALLRTWGITAQDWNALVASGSCPICERRYDAAKPARRAVLDHRHSDGLIRGSPCASCNYRLGVLADDDEWLLRAAQYLLTPPAVALLGERFVPGGPPTNGGT